MNIFSLSAAGPALALLASSLLATSDSGATDEAFIFGLPKAELHVHLEGTMEPELYIEIARRNRISTPYATPEDVRNRLRAARDLPTFIAIYEELIGAVRTERDFHDIALGYFRKARSQGVVYAEVFFDPQLHVERGVKLATIYAGLESARREASAELGLEAHYILSFLRDRPAEDAARVLEQSLPWRKQLIGVGLDNPEVKDFPLRFKAVFARAKALGLHLTSHCDVDQPDTVAHHWGALDVLGVERIDHGLNVLNDPGLIEAVRRRHIGLTAAPTLFYTEIPGRMEYRAGAIRKLLDLGLLVSVNSDDPGMKRSLYVGDLMLRVQQTTGMSREQMTQLARNSFEIAWMGAAQRERYLAAVDSYEAAGRLR
ncbi:MAG: adenosine deaminase [Gammaproteobacteria bacterium]